MTLNDCKWNFGIENGSDDGPNDAMSENFNSKPIVSLVREVIQNSLDAVHDKSKPVKVVFEYKTLDCKKGDSLLEIKNHISECLNTYQDNENAMEFFPPMLSYLNSVEDSRKIQCLKISDYNTLGMEFEEHSTKSPFYAFVRSKGVTVKNSASSGGSFGFGKAAYFGMSKIKSLIISTRTVRNNVFFEGVSTLCTHYHEGKKLTSVGFFDNKDGLRPQDNELLIPEEFLREKDSFGTDFWVIGCEKNPAHFDQMIKAALVNFWLAIYRNELEIVIDSLSINSVNLETLLKEYFPNEFDKPSSNRETYNPRPYLDAVKNGDLNNNIYKKIVKENLPKLGTVTFYAKLDTEGSSKIVCTRKPKMLVQLLQGRPVGFYGVFICETDEGNKNLQRMENPAHTQWNKGRKADSKEVYEIFEKFIKESVDSLRPSGERKSYDVIGLDQFLGIPDSLIQKNMELEESNKGMSNPVHSQNNGERKKKKHDLEQEQKSKSVTTDEVGDKILEDDDNDNTKEKDKDREDNKDKKERREKKKAKKKFVSEIEVELFQIAKKENGRTVHVLKLLNSGKHTYSNVKISVLAIGDYEKEIPSISYTIPSYQIEDNVIKNVNLPLGLTEIKVYFSDNLTRSLRIFVNK